MRIIKLGGSAISNKVESSSSEYLEDEIKLEYPVREEAIWDIGEVLREYSRDGLILVHGGGTYGHRTVSRWKSGIVGGSEDMRIWEIKWRMLQLSQKVIRFLGSSGVPAVEVSPSDIMIAREGLILRMDPTIR